MKFIGHLDTMRYFQKVIRRAGIDAAFSEGFSPHIIMSFAQPLSVGVESNGEYFDLEVKSYTTVSDMMERMNLSCTEDARILDMSLLPEKSKKAMAEVYAARYSVSYAPGHGSEFDIESAVEKFNNASSVIVEKKSKKSVREIELKDLVHELKVGDGNSLDMLLAASSADNVKPGLLIRALRELETGEAPDPNEEYPGKADLFIIREEIFDSAMKPLIKAGVPF